MKNSLYYILQKLLKKHSIKIDENELKFQLLSHPSYPSLHSLTGVLCHFRIDNLALEIPKNVESLNYLPEFFIAHIKNERLDELVLVSLKDRNAILIFDNKRSETISIKDFMILWTGVIVVVEKDKEYVKSVVAQNIGLKKYSVFIVFIACSVLFFINKPDIFPIIHYLLSFIGFGMSTVIVKHELGFDSKVADKFCFGNIEKINCNDVLKSKGAIFFKFFSFSDIGIIYFASIILSWILILLSDNYCDFLILLSILAIPFTFYSIGYQYFAVKKWCTLCLSVVFILWLQAISLYFVDFTSLLKGFNLFEATVVMSCFVTVLGLWQFILPKLKKDTVLNNLKIDYGKFKRNYSLYEALNAKSDQINSKIDEISEIAFGNPEGKLKIMIITNPLCGFCKETHQLFEELLMRNHQEISLTIRFNLHLDKNSYETRIALKLIDLFNVNKEMCLQAMNEIYGNIKPNKWLSKWGETKKMEYVKILNIEKQWCVKNKINFTPVILVNERPFPKEYDRMDLLYFINDIIEYEQQNKEILTSEYEFTT